MMFSVTHLPSVRSSMKTTVAIVEKNRLERQMPLPPTSIPRLLNKPDSIKFLRRIVLENDSNSESLYSSFSSYPVKPDISHYPS